VLVVLSATGCSNKAELERAQEDAEKNKEEAARLRDQLAELKKVAEKNKVEAARLREQLAKLKPGGDDTKSRIRIKCDEVIDYYADKAPQVNVRVERRNYSGPVRVMFVTWDSSLAKGAFMPQRLSVSYLVLGGEDNVTVDVGRCIAENTALKMVGRSETAIVSVSPTLPEHGFHPPERRTEGEDARIDALIKAGKLPERYEKVVRLVFRGNRP
jgi:hypothetical protein